MTEAPKAIQVKLLWRNWWREDQWNEEKEKEQLTVCYRWVEEESNWFDTHAAEGEVGVEGF